jgi:hypothetical protein
MTQAFPSRNENSGKFVVRGHGERLYANLVTLE